MTDYHTALEVILKRGTVVIFRGCWTSCITLLHNGVAIGHKGCVHLGCICPIPRPHIIPRGLRVLGHVVRATVCEGA